MGCQITWHPTRVVVAGIVYRHVRVHAKRARTHNRVQTHTMSPATYRSCSAVPWLVVTTHPPNYGDPTRDKHPRPSLQHHAGLSARNPHTVVAGGCCGRRRHSRWTM